MSLICGLKFFLLAQTREVPRAGLGNVRPAGHMRPPQYFMWPPRYKSSCLNSDNIFYSINSHFLSLTVNYWPADTLYVSNTALGAKRGAHPWPRAYANLNPDLGQSDIGSQKSSWNYKEILIRFAALSLGYNHPSMLKIWEDDHNVKTLVNRPALGFYPGVEWPDMLRRVLLAIAPPGLNQVQLG